MCLVNVQDLSKDQHTKHNDRYEPFDNYFNLNPPEFGLTYGIFAVDGQAEGNCPPPSSTPPPPPPPPPSTTTTSTTYIPPPVTTSSTVWLPWTPSTTYSVPPETTEWIPWQPSSSRWTSYAPPVSGSSYWSDWVKSSSEAAVYSSASTWAEWHSAPAPASTSGWKSPRSLHARAALVPKACYKVCDNCGLEAQYIGKVFTKLCEPDSVFQEGLIGCHDCISANGGTPPVVVEKLIHQFDPWVNWCLANKPAVPGTILASSSTTIVTTSASSPTSSLTTTTPSPPPPASSLTTTTPSPPPPVQGSSTTSSTAVTTTPIGSTSSGSTTACAISQISDGQPQATDCTLSVASYTPPTPSINSYTSSGAQPTQGPAAGLIVGVVAIMAMV
jgi:hypothetical protein